MKLKVGDRVKLSEYGLGWFGRRREKEGTIIDIREHLYPYCVEWDEVGRGVYKARELSPADINEEELYY